MFFFSLAVEMVSFVLSLPVKMVSIVSSILKSGFAIWIYLIICVISLPFFKALISVCVNILWFMLWQSTYEKVGYDDEATERGDKYIDKMLEEMFENEEEYDPYKIEDSTVGFWKKVVFVNISGEAKFHDGYILGLKTLHRSGHCSLKDGNGILNVKADLAAGELDFQYSGSAKFMNVGPTLSVKGTLAYIETHMEFVVDSKTGKNGELKKFIIDDMRGLKVWITGLGPLNWAMNPIVAGVTTIFKRMLRNVLENKVEKYLAERIPNFQFPVEGVNVDATETSTQTEPEPPRTEPLTEGPSEEHVVDTDPPQKETTETEITEISKTTIEVTEDIDVKTTEKDETAEPQVTVQPEAEETTFDDLSIIEEMGIKTSDSRESGEISLDYDLERFL